MRLKANVNDIVRVKLTNHGKDILREFCRAPNGEVLGLKLPKASGIYEFQIHELMRIFGQHQYNGAETVFEKNQIIFTQS